MKTTLDEIRAYSPHIGDWSRLLSGLKKSSSDDEPLSLITIFEITDIEFALWCIRSVEFYDKGKRIMSLAFKQELSTLTKTRFNPLTYNRVQQYVEEYDAREDVDYSDPEGMYDDEYPLDYSAHTLLCFTDRDVRQKQIKIFKKICRE